MGRIKGWSELERKLKAPVLEAERGEEVLGEDPEAGRQVPGSHQGAPESHTRPV